MRRAPLRAPPRALLALVVAAPLGCQKTTYQWGTYQDSVEELIVAQDPEQLEEQLQRLSLELEQAANSPKPIPPGMRAHVAYLYYINGETGPAVELMRAEKAAFPESATFVDGMIGRMQR